MFPPSSRILLFPVLLAGCASLRASEYAVVVKESTAAEPVWAKVAAALEAKHQGRRLVFAKEPAETLAALKEMKPRRIAFVAPPAECTKPFVRAVHALVRGIDDDPYADAFWGIVTGFTPEDALAAVAEPSPLVIRRVAAGTSFPLDHCEEGVWFSEREAGKIVRKARGGKAVEEKGPADSIAGLVATLNEWKPDLFLTSGHATERDWQPGYSYRNGAFRSAAGELTGHDLSGGRHQVRSPNPKAYLPIGNCLMGHIDGPDAMALAWMHSAGVRQMVGYIEPTWYGYMGWGLLDYFLEQPGRFTLVEAFFANHAALIHRLATLPADGAGQDRKGLEFDRDHVALYGDPAWEARMAPGPLGWKQTLLQEQKRLVLEIEPLAGETSFATIDTNGSQRGGRPIIQLLGVRIDAGRARVAEGAEWKPVVADDFILVPRPPVPGPERPIRIVIDWP